ncbi:MAG: 16S rRNA (uracil(1498)-N(3))-methyltransferase [Legionella sp.]
MKLIRIYQPGHYQVGQLVELSASAAQHVGTVLRMQQHDQFVLFSGSNQEYLSVITDIQKKKVIVKIVAANTIDRESSLKIHLAQAISKGERMELVIQKTVELGVSSVTPIISARCVVKLDCERLEKKRLQWQAIAIAACEQSGRNCVPEILAPMSIDDYLRQCSQRLKFILYPGASKSWRDYPVEEQELALLIGPEGGLTGAEIDTAMSRQFLPLSLGPRILRTETAAIAALALFQAVSGNL